MVGCGGFAAYFSYFGVVSVGMHDEGLSRGRVPSSCPICIGRLRVAFEEFNVTQNIAVFDETCFAIAISQLGEFNLSPSPANLGEKEIY